MPDHLIVRAEGVREPQGSRCRSRTLTLLQNSFLQPLWSCLT